MPLSRWPRPRHRHTRSRRGRSMTDNASAPRSRRALLAAAAGGAAALAASAALPLTTMAANDDPVLQGRIDNNATATTGVTQLHGRQRRLHGSRGRDRFRPQGLEHRAAPGSSAGASARPSGSIRSIPPTRGSSASRLRLRSDRSASESSESATIGVSTETASSGSMATDRTEWSAKPTRRVAPA